ncbi:MAG: hypothetical protein AAF492_32975, partial [Verrucomicrobiota bacterium]
MDIFQGELAGLKQALDEGRLPEPSSELTRLRTRIEEIGDDKESETPGDVEPASAPADETADVAATTADLRNELKINADRLDLLIDTIGELVIRQSMLSQSETLSRDLPVEVVENLESMGRITRQLQDMGTSLRMIPLKATFQRLALLARNLSRDAGKNIEFVYSGEETELDKSLVDRIWDPLVHLVRNAVDHGMESDPDERIEHGKPAVGRIELTASHLGGGMS